MASSVAHRRLIRATYKGLLRAAEKLDAAPVAVAAAAEPFAARVAPFLPAGAAPVPASASSFAAVVRAQFRAGAADAAAPKSALVDAALRAMALANQRLAAAADAASASASAAVAAPALAAVAAPPKPSSVLYSVGQVFTHRASGYRGVIIGWDTACKAGDKWVAATRTDALPHGTAQPFYHVLVDVRDRPDARIAYVAQDNVELLPTPRAVAEREAASAVAAGSGDASAAAAEGIVIHPLLTRYFTNIRLNAAATAASAFTGNGSSAGGSAAGAEEDGALAALPVYYQPTAKLAAAYPRDTPHAVALAPLLRLRAATAAAGAAAAAARAAAAAAAQANAALQHVWLGGSVSGGAEGEMRTGSSAAGAGEDSDDDGSDDDDDVKHNSNGRAARLE